MTPSAAGVRRAPSRAWLVGLMILTVIPVVVAVVRALHDGWIPTGDNALIATRVHAVFSVDTPLLGVVSSASGAAGTLLNHPGPLLFEWLAIPTTVLGRDAGVVVGVGLLNALALVAISWVGWRRGGVGGAGLAALFGSSLAWAMGSELLYDPWQPHSQMLPALAFLFLAWSVASTDLVLAPLAVVMGSMVMQTHLTYVFLVPVVLAVAVVMGVRAARRAHSNRRVAPALLVALIVGLAVWTPPLIEQVTSSRGNMTRLLSQAGKGSDAVGLVGAVRLSSDVVALPPFWFRPSMTRTFVPDGGSVGTTTKLVSEASAWPTAVAVLAWTSVIALLLLCGWRARTRPDQPTVAAVAVSLGAIVAGWMTASTIRVGAIGLGAHEFRYLWPIAVFVWFTLAWAAWHQVVDVSASRVRGYERPALIVTVGAVVVISASNLFVAPAGGGPQIVAGAVPVVADLERGLRIPPAERPVLAEWLTSYFLEPYSPALLSELARRDIEFVVTDRVLVRQFGSDRRFTGRNARSRLFFLDGPRARHRRSGDFRRIAFHDGRAIGVDPATADRRTVGVFLGPVDGCTPLIRVPTCRSGA